MISAGPHVSGLRRAVARVFDLLVPHVCASCAAVTDPLTGPLCENCAWELSAQVGGDYCRTCGEDRGAHLLLEGRCTACRLGKQPLKFDEFIRVGRYAGALRQLILRFKREFVMDHFLGGLLAGAIHGKLDPHLIDLWVPVPSHWRRRLSRGFQPTRLLADAAVRKWHGSVEPVLSMSRYVPPFHRGMSPSDRTDAISGAFRVRRHARLNGRRICLVDDVTTTGATLAEAKRALRKAGARWVAVAVLAKVSNLPMIPHGVDPSRCPP